MSGAVADGAADNGFVAGGTADNGLVADGAAEDGLDADDVVALAAASVAAEGGDEPAG